jgi:hypothetical protein
MRVFAAIWTIGIVLLDLVCVRSIGTHAWSGTYPHVEGVVVASRVTTEHTSDGDTHGVAIEYTYAVDGRTYRGTRYRGVASSQGGTWAADIVRGFPAGARVPVYYASADPADAVLRAGLDGGDAFFPFFLVPFNMAALGMWTGIRRWARIDRPGDVTGGLTVIEDRDVVRVLPETYPPAGMALLAAGLATFLLGFVVVFPFGWDPPGRVAALAWAAVALVAAVTYARAAARRNSGAGELVIDTMAHTLRFPQRRADPREPVPWSTIEEVVVEARASQSSSFDGGSVSSTFWWVVVGLTDGRRVRVRSALWTMRAPAERFRGWLEARIRVSN